jgi:hypothetical protein
MARRSLPVVSEIPLYEGDMEADLKLVSRNQLADRITGGLAKPSKMPTYSWGISATRCQMGQLLVKKPGSVCSECYALKGRYFFPNVQTKLEERYQGLFNPLWTPAMVFLVNYYCDRYFRWFDSGDLQGENHLRNIVTVATATPQVSHWLPTREAGIVRGVENTAANLVIRVSGAMVDGGHPTGFEHTSEVVSEARLAHPGSMVCPSLDQGGRCGECRACWDADVGSVSYRLH